MVIRPDNTVLFYHEDSLSGTVTYAIVRHPGTRERQAWISLVLAGTNDQGDQYGIGVIDRDQVILGPINEADALGFRYVRQR